MDKKSKVNGVCASKKYEVACSKKLGRYLISSKALASGELIFREDVLAVGPATFEEGIFCFACMRPLAGYRDNRCNRYACSKCNVAPLCNRACENIGKFHSIRECELFQRNEDLYRNSIEEVTRILLHLRLWLLKDNNNNNNNDSWSKIEEMEAHLDKRRNTPVWQEREATIVDVFRKLELHTSTDPSDESIQRICGIADVNTFELRAPGVQVSEIGPLRGLFVEAALMAHECRPSAHVSVDESFHMTVHAAVDIPAGGLISFNYTSSLLGTYERQEHLQEGKYFRCECRACRDPLEAGSNLSCLLCPRCKQDYVAVQTASDREPYSDKAKWQCRGCKRIFSGCLVKSTVEIAKGLVEDVDVGNFKAMDGLLEKLGRTFHRNHYLMLSLKNKILVLCRREISGSLNPQRKTLQRMLDLCREVLVVLEIVEPGLSRLKGIVLYEMHLPTTILANRAYAGREIGAKELLARLEEAKELLRRSLTMLLLEPATTPEGQLARRALQEIKLLAQSVEDAKALALAFEDDDNKVVGLEVEKKKQQRRRGRGNNRNRQK